MSLSEEPTLYEVMQGAYDALKRDGYGRFLSSTYLSSLGTDALVQLPEVLDSFHRLTDDQHMGDGGTYRKRAYSRFSIEPEGWGPMKVSRIDGNSIYQTTEDNPVNGGVLRTFQPLEPEVANGPFLHSLIEHDFAHAFNCDSSLLSSAVVVGVHQVRIVARGESPGLPTPEGIHKDAELFTFQHFMARHNVEGGEFRAYTDSKELACSWLQTDCLDTVMFRGTTWHSATPISCARPDEGEGYRDIFLIDFERL